MAGEHPQRRLGSLLIIAAFGCAGVALLRQGWWLWLLWPAVAMATVGSGYLFIGPRTFGKRPAGTMRLTHPLGLFPWLFYTYSIWHVLRVTKSEVPYDQLLPDVWIGRRLRANEYPEMFRQVVDLTSEFPEPAVIRQKLKYHPFHVLDASAPSPQVLSDWIHSLDPNDGCLYIHCAEGHGRTGLFAAALLLDRGLAKSPEEAVHQVQSARSLVRLNAPQRARLSAFYALRNDESSRF